MHPQAIEMKKTGHPYHLILLTLLILVAFIFIESCTRLLDDVVQPDKTDSTKKTGKSAGKVIISSIIGKDKDLGMLINDPFDKK